MVMTSPSASVVVAERGTARASVDRDGGATGHAWLPHAARHHGRMRSLAAAARQYALRREKAVNVLRLRFLAHQDHLLAFPAVLLGRVRVEHDLARSGTRRRGQPPRERSHAVIGTQRRHQELLQERRRNPQQSLCLGDETGLEHLYRGDHHRPRIHLAVARLQAIEPPTLDRELEVLHLFVVALELVAQLEKLSVEAGHLLRHRRDRLRCADARDYVLALGVHEVLAVHDVLAGGRIAGEANTGGRVVAHVAKDHRADVDRRSVGHRRRDPELSPIIDGTLAIPRLEHRLDREFELLVGIGDKIPAGVLSVDSEECVGEFLERVGGQLNVVHDAMLVLDRRHRRVEGFVGNAHRDLAEQLDEAPVCVPGEALIASPGGEALQRCRVEAEVEDSVHHSGHRHCRS